MVKICEVEDINPIHRTDTFEKLNKKSMEEDQIQEKCQHIS